jgi:hypothetical protein
VYGLGQNLSLFTRALLETLNGAGSVKRGNQWIVRTDTMLSALNETLRWQGPLHGLPSQSASLDHASGFDLHFLQHPPAVHVCIGCDPAAANGAAWLTAKGRNGQHTRASLSADPWKLQCSPGSYDVAATFDPNSRYKTSLEHAIIVPPYVELSLDVT